MAAGDSIGPDRGRRRRARALGRARCRGLTSSRCGRGSRGSRPPARGWSRSPDELDPAVRPRCTAWSPIGASPCASRACAAALPRRREPAGRPRADRRGARRRRVRARPSSARARSTRHSSRRSPPTARARTSSRSSPTSRSCPFPASSSTRAGRTSRPAASWRAIPRPGERNWSIARVRPLGGSRALVGIAPNHHLAVAARAARERGRAPADRRHDRQSPGAAGRGVPLPRARRGRAARRRRAARRARRSSCAAGTFRSRCPPAARSSWRASSTSTTTVEEGPVSEFHGGYERYGRCRDGDVQLPDTPERCALPDHPAGLPSRARHARAALRSPRAWSAGCGRACRRCGPSRCPRAAPDA